jgi:hypothetical protein
MEAEMFGGRCDEFLATMIGWTALEAAVGCVVATVCVYVGWTRHHVYWPPPVAPPQVSGEGPYRCAPVDHRLSRRPPLVVRAATFSGLLAGQLAIAGAATAGVYCVLLGARSEARQDLLLAKGLALVVAVAIAAGVHLLHIGPLLLGRAERSCAVASRAAGWSMGLGVSLFVLLFAVLGGAIGQHEGWLCLTLLGGSLAGIAEGILLNSAVEVISDEERGIA